MIKNNKKYSIPNHEGYYVDVEGNVYSRWINKGKHGIVLGDKYKKLQPKLSKSGHRFVSLGRNHQKLVHRLVYESIIGPIPEGMVVRHLNDKPSDNRIENLAIGTQKDNMQDCLRNGHFNPTNKIKSSEYRKIEKLKQNHTWKEIAEMYSVNEKTVRNHMKKHQKKRGNIA